MWQLMHLGTVNNVLKNYIYIYVSCINKWNPIATSFTSFGMVLSARKVKVAVSVGEVLVPNIIMEFYQAFQICYLCWWNWQSNLIRQKKFIYFVYLSYFSLLLCLDLIHTQGNTLGPIDWYRNPCYTAYFFAHSSYVY